MPPNVLIHIVFSTVYFMKTITTKIPMKIILTKTPTTCACVAVTKTYKQTYTKTMKKEKYECLYII